MCNFFIMTNKVSQLICIEYILNFGIIKANTRSNFFYNFAFANS
ncbi:Uncharacterised protein [Acinetobacter baumannii]|nr:Uncharacterised protein [Acinetobacter baumannii]